MKQFRLATATRNVDFDAETRFTGINLSKVNFNLAALVYDLALSQQRIAHLEKRSPVLAWFLKVTTDYGRSLLRWLVWCIGVVIFFTILYFCVGGIVNNKSLLDSFYFSIVTFTTLGYGDIHPTEIFPKILVVIEVILGYVMGGLLVAILTKKVMG